MMADFNFYRKLQHQFNAEIKKEKTVKLFLADD